MREILTGDHCEYHDNDDDGVGDDNGVDVDEDDYHDDDTYYDTLIVMRMMT